MGYGRASVPHSWLETTTGLIVSARESLKYLQNEQWLA